MWPEVSLWFLIPLATFLGFVVWLLGVFVAAKLLYSPQKARASANRKQLVRAVLSGGTLTLGETALLEDFDTSSHTEEIMMQACLWPILVVAGAILLVFIGAALLVIEPVKLIAHLAKIPAEEG